MAPNAKYIFLKFLVCFPSWSLACCKRCTVTCFCFNLPPFSFLPGFPLFWDGPNYSSPMCGWTLWSLTRSHWLMRSINPSLCHSSVFLIYIHSHPIIPPLKRLISFHTFSISFSIEFVTPDHPFHPHKPGISMHSLLLFILRMYYSSQSVITHHLHHLNE